MLIKVYITAPRRFCIFSNLFNSQRPLLHVRVNW